MPPYVSAPGTNTPVQQLEPGRPSYAFGSFSGSRQNTLLQITAVAKAASVATYTVLVREGDIPIVGALLTTRGLATAGFNQNNVAITAVSIAAATGIGTIQTAISAGTVVTTPDAGQGYVPVTEIGETCADGTSRAFAIPQPSNGADEMTVVRMEVSFPSAPVAVTITMQAAETNLDANYKDQVTLDQNGGLTSVGNVRWRFIRAKISGTTGGTNPTAVVKFLV